jgi:hypothetical protein
MATEQEKLKVRYSKNYLRGAGRRVMSMISHCFKKSDYSDKEIIDAIQKAAMPLRTEVAWLKEHWEIEQALKHLGYDVCPDVQKSLASIENSRN